MKTREELIQYFKEHDKVRTLDAHQAKAHSVGWSCDGRYLASGSSDKTLAIYQLDNGSKLIRDQTCRGHTDEVDQILWSRTNPDLLSSCGRDKTVRLWDTRSRKQAANIATKGENINMAASPDGNTIAVGNKADYISFIDVRTHKSIDGHQCKSETNEIAWNPDGSLFFALTGSGQIMVYNWPIMEVKVTLQAHMSNAICIDFDPTGKYFAVGGNDCLVSIWDAKWLAPVRMMDRYDWAVRSVSFSHDGRLLASGPEDMAVDIAEVESGRRVAEIRCEAPTFSVDWNPKTYLLAYSGDDKLPASMYDRSRPDREAGTVKVYGFASD